MINLIWYKTLSTKQGECVEYLNNEEQYQLHINDEQISRIKDPILKEIRLRYWKKQNEIFLDEYGVPDSKLNEIYRKIENEEIHEIENYKRNI